MAKTSILTNKLETAEVYPADGTGYVVLEKLEDSIWVTTEYHETVELGQTSKTNWDT
jgi:hypothetical protein|tara:strand:+ start:539 stop:709 length:171 start_codon:yes stop_codon:yes gene_type:complete